MTTTATELVPPKQPRRVGAPVGNANRTRHGMRGAGLPPGCGHIQRATCAFRREVEAAVLEARGEITLVDAASINTAFRAERHAQLAQRWLAVEAESMTPADRLNYSREVARASELRDKALAALDLPRRRTGDQWRVLHVNPTNVSAVADNAPAARVESQEQT